MDKKKLAAALAAVTAHIKTTEAAAAMAAAQTETAPALPEPVPVPVRPHNTWGITGRQALMQANTMMQMRMFK